MEHSAVLVRILASCCRRCRAFCVWLWIFPVVNIADYPGVIGNTRAIPPGNFFQKFKPSHRSLTQGCAHYHSARTFDPSLHYRSFGRSLSLCLHRTRKLSRVLALAAWAKKQKRLDSSSAFLHCVMLSPLCPSSPISAGHVCILLIDVILSLDCCIILT